MGVARVEFAECVAYSNDGAAIELVVWNPFSLEPTAISKAVPILPAKPLLAAQVFGIFLKWLAHIGL